MPLKKSIDCLTGMRFFAALCIVFWHSQGGFFFRNYAFRPFQLDGAVQLFFALSGFVLTISRNDEKGYAEFMGGRIARIWPTHLVAFAFLICVFYSVDSPHWVIDHPLDSGLFVFLLQAWVPKTEVIFGFNGPAWSLSVELFFYAVFPVCVILLRRNPVLRSAALFASTLIAILLIGRWFPNVNAVWLGYANPLTNLCVFAMGISAGLLWRDAPPAGTSLTRATALEVGAISIALLANSAFSAPYQVDHPTAIGWFMLTTAAAPTYVLVIYVLARYRGIISLILSRKPIVLLGQASFALYLFHQILLKMYWQYRDFFGVLGHWPSFALFLLSSLGLAFAAHFGVEVPTYRIVTSWLRAKRPVVEGGKVRLTRQ
ncbi:acyltransferase [Paraburkholderia sp. SARCC-3016]|uniref:acyltransferase family protein n=1 Tax=Paraburkholderia sp. SARCC-3016 TaxID=3058611 RepID=UPI002808C058|nr:acyltransferase [Paraburkholderia sp. SARCC-3016]MDQ7978073.1 acyltransferase [Paraburkholderia sp. SARCC-3016]